MNYTRSRRALSINGKRIDIGINDVLHIAESYTIKNAKNVVLEIENGIRLWNEKAKELELPSNIIQSINKDFNRLI